MEGVGRQLRASTLVETLVMMLVAGIVFLAAMDSLTLLSRLVTRRTVAIVETERQSEGFARIAHLLATADSLAAEEESPAVYGTSPLTIWRGGHPSQLLSRDSAVLFVAGGFRDTLLRRVGRMRFLQYGAAADTVEIKAAGHTLKFPVPKPARQRYETTIAGIENGYGYEAP